MADPEELREKRSRAFDAWAAGVRDIAGIRYARATIDNFAVTRESQATALNVVKGYLDDFDAQFARGAGILFIGPVGTGKDHLACAALRVIASQLSRTTRWVSCSALFEEFRDLIRREERTESQTIAKYVRPDVLVLSDPPSATGVLSEFQMGVLLRIVNERYGRMLPTFATLNIASRPECEQRIGPQLTDRLFDRAVLVKCDWPSYRQPTN